MNFLDARPLNYLLCIFLQPSFQYPKVLRTVFDYSVDLEAQRIQMIAVALAVQIRGKFP
jgi:hypothetical protein